MTRGPNKFGVSAYDIATRDKIPVVKRLMASGKDGLALDIGIGTGYTTCAVFGDRPTACVDLHAPNLEYYRRTTAGDSQRALFVIAPATRLPFKEGVFNSILCSEVLEHLEDDDAAVCEIARVLGSDGRVVITVPYTGLGFAGFLELCGIKTVHDFPGPEHHVRPGYDEGSLGELFSRHGLVIVEREYYLRFFTKVIVDLVSVAHILYQRVVNRRRAWTWSDAAGLEGGWAFRLYTWVFPVLWAFSRLDRILSRRRGFGLVVSLRKE